MLTEQYAIHVSFLSKANLLVFVKSKKALVDKIKIACSHPQMWQYKSGFSISEPNLRCDIILHAERNLGEREIDNSKGECVNLVLGEGEKEGGNVPISVYKQ